MPPNKKKIIYEDRIVAFVDILGFRTMINERCAGNISNILSIPKKHFKNLPLDKYKNIEISTFSDSIIISFIYTEEHAVYNLLVDLENILIKFIYMDVICRGAIVKGKIIHNQKYLFGPAFVEAYELEKKMKYPKIGFFKEIYDIGCMYHHQKNTIEKEENFIKTLCIKDDDDNYFIDYFSTPIASVCNVITVNRKKYLLKLIEITNNGLKNMNPCVREKYIWLKDKLKDTLNNLLNFSDEMYELVFKDIKKDDIKYMIQNIS